MAISLQSPTRAAVFNGATSVHIHDERLHIPADDEQKLRSLVRSNLGNLDRYTLEEIVRRAYHLGNESCHRAMSSQAADPEPHTLADLERVAIQRTFLSTHGDAI